MKNNSVNMTLKVLKNNYKRYLVFSRKNFTDLIYQDTLCAVPEIMRTLRVSFEDLKNNPDKMVEASDLSSRKIFKGALMTELFYVWHIFSNFYKDPEIGIEVKDDIAEKDISAKNLDDLKRITKIDTLVDFVIYSQSIIRLFQLKNYHGDASTQDLWAYLKSVLIHYSKDLGSVNLLVVLSGRGGLLNIDFNVLANKLKTLGLKSDSWIMVSFNENNQKVVINQIFPSLTRSEIPLVLDYPELQDKYARFIK